MFGNRLSSITFNPPRIKIKYQFEIMLYQTILFILADERAAALAATLSAANLSTTDVSKG